MDYSYHFGMEKRDESWRQWVERMDRHVKNSGAKWSKIAETIATSEGGVRHWRNGTREINLSDFFKLCDAAGADAREILFNADTLPQSPAVTDTEADLSQLIELVEKLNRNQQRELASFAKYLLSQVRPDHVSSITYSAKPSKLRLSVQESSPHQKRTR